MVTQSVPARQITEAEYLAFERQSPTRHEYYRGEIFAMAGASRNHGRIAGNAYAALHRQLLARPCELYMNDMRVKSLVTGLFAYPDIAVVCGEPLFIDEVLDTLLNPTALIEVLSPSTEAYDRGGKFELYRTIESFQEYLLVAQDRPRVEHYARQADGGWLLRDLADIQASLHLNLIHCTLTLAEIYAKITFDDAPSPPLQR
jgi:Uma2 family endonuclease